MYPEFGSYHILNHCTKAKGAKQNQVPTEALAYYVACTSCSGVSFTSVCDHGSRKIKFYHQANMVLDANCQQSTQFRTQKEQSSITSAAVANTMPASLTTKKLSTS